MDLLGVTKYTRYSSTLKFLEPEILSRGIPFVVKVLFTDLIQSPAGMAGPRGVGVGTVIILVFVVVAFVIRTLVVMVGPSLLLAEYLVQRNGG